MDTFIKLLKFRGHTFSRDINDRGPHINVKEVLFSFGIREKNKRIPGTKLYDSSTYVPTGILILKIGESYKAMEWSDGATKLEKQLAKIVAKIELEAEKELEWREKCRISQIKREEQEKIRKEYEARKEFEFDKNACVTYKKNFKGTLSFISVKKEDGKMELAFQIECPGFNFDLSFK